MLRNNILYSIFKELRPIQWIKNLSIFAGLFLIAIGIKSGLLLLFLFNLLRSTAPLAMFREQEGLRVRVSS
jgi:hypothetical protein